MLMLVYWPAAIARLGALRDDYDNVEIGGDGVLSGAQSVGTRHWQEQTKNNLKLEGECVPDFCQQLSREGDSSAVGSA